MHGGPRKGAGRPRVGRMAVTLKLSPEINAKLMQAARDAGVSKSEFAEAAIIEKVKRLAK
jgi:predicted transcriptional regulator